MSPRLGAEFLLARPDLGALDDKRLVWIVTADAVWRRVDHGSIAAAERSLSLMCPGQRALYSTSRCLGETRNGGLHQFFYNTAGVLWREACAGFRLLGAEGLARIVERAAGLFPKAEPPDECAARRAALANLNFASFRALTDGFFALHRAEECDIDRLQARYIRAHPEDFFA